MTYRLLTKPVFLLKSRHLNLPILFFKQLTQLFQPGIKIVFFTMHMFYIIVLYRGESTAEDSLCVQICVLYYVLLYEDVRLANMKNILSTGRKVIIAIFEKLGAYICNCKDMVYLNRIF